MSNVKISLCASANRVEWWQRFYNSLQYNNIEWEVIFVGDRKPIHNFPPNFKWVHATVKPAQCYQIAFWEAQGELIAWTADDVDYNAREVDCSNCLDIAYKHWVDMDSKYNNDKKSVVAFRPIENGGDVWRFHHLFGGWEETPTMAPFALIDRNYFLNTLGGYDSRFISGQSENSIIMEVYQNGGRVEIDLDAKLYVRHSQVHPRDPNTGKEDNKFRKWYNEDRKVLENLWIQGGYGYYEKLNSFKNNTPESRKEVVKLISKTMISPKQKFEKRDDVCLVTQGQKGHWQ
jgi:hypothetical protein